MTEGQIYILQDIPIDLTMPDDSVISFILKKPNSTSNPFTFEMTEEAPSGSRIYKDPSRTKRKSFCDYYPVFRLNYERHRMFTTLLLVAKNIALKTSPGFLSNDNHIVTNCIFGSSSVRKDWANGMNLAAYSSESEEKANPIQSGNTELTFLGIEPLKWNEALSNYYLYKRRDSSDLLASSSELISNPDIIISE